MIKSDLNNTINLLKRIGISFLTFTICRALFQIFNFDQFSSLSFSETIYVYFWGLRFDLVMICYAHSAFIVFSCIPFKFRDSNGYQLFLKLLFHIVNGILVAFNLLDLEYFKFTSKRSTFDLFEFINTGNDTLTLLPQFILDFWYAIALLIGIIWLTNFLYKKTITNKSNHSTKYYLVNSVVFILLCGLSIIGTRGGTQVRPLSIVSAGSTGIPKAIPLTLNTPFSIFFSMDKKITPPQYYSDEELEGKIKTKHQYSTGISDKKNVFVIILESFSAENMGFLGSKSGLTPFLDSLSNHCTIYPNFYANGKKSMDALPAIYAGIPNLMRSPYIISPYSSNEIYGVPVLLREEGYHTSFFHGGTNGTMAFDFFSKLLGNDEYYGRNEYPDPSHFDGKWGIPDEEFFQYTAQKVNTFPKPFFTSLFSLSSHHPFIVPQNRVDEFTGGEIDLHNVIQYTDNALKLFFESIRDQDWFNNTIFYITADHTSYGIDRLYGSRCGWFKIPLLVYDPNTTKSTPTMDSIIGEHIDIGPTILEHIGYQKEFFSLGKSLSSERNQKYAITLVDDAYQIIDDKYILIFDGEKVIGLFDKTNDYNLRNDLSEQLPEKTQELTEYLKTYIQTYLTRLVKNRLHLQE